MGLVLTSPQLASSDPSVQADIGVGRIRITAIRHAFQSLTRSRTLREQHRYSRRRLHTQAGIAMSILVQSLSPYDCGALEAVRRFLP